MQGSQALLVLLLAKDFVKSKTDSAQSQATLQNAHMMFFKGVTLFSYNFYRICGHIYNVNQVDSLLGKEV